MNHTPQRGTMDPAELGRLRWRCRRGMRELDVLLVRYLERDWPTAAAADCVAFRALLERQDPEINALLLGRMAPDDEALARVLECLRRPA
jgi:antitoxin CptB